MPASQKKTQDIGYEYQYSKSPFRVAISNIDISVLQTDLGSSFVSSVITKMRLQQTVCL